MKNLTGVSPFTTGGAYSGSVGSAKWLTNWAMPFQMKIEANQLDFSTCNVWIRT